MWPIIKITYREMISKRIFTITLIMSLAFLLLFGLATGYAIKEMKESFGGLSPEALLQKNFFSTQLLGMGLYFGSVITALLAILSSVGSIASEIESHQIDTWLARALPRYKYVLGKFFGLASMLGLYALLMFFGLLGINQWVGEGMLAVQVDAGQILKAAAFFVSMPIILVCVAMFLSSMTTTVTGGIILIILYGISFVGGFIEQLGAVFSNSSLTNIGIISSLLFPADSLFRQATLSLFDSADDPLSFASQGIFGTTSPPSTAMLIYTIFYGIVALGLSIRVFQKRDV
ncbi:ABC transporter permease subunit [Brevibacillus sp. FIR094]|uniref:ABC transporter permease subunit n=1 Tax=Brevibacillus sp. FIR094 TaxID=3134809 RepID=UPI003D190D47